VGFSGALDSAHARDLGAYRLVTPGKDKAFGTRDDKVAALVGASYDPGTHTVTLTPRRKASKKALQLAIAAVRVLDAQGRPIDGDRDGQPGGDFRTTLGGKGLRIRLADDPGPGRVGRVSAEAIDSRLAP
jgi:hypothetical protein